MCLQRLNRLLVDFMLREGCFDCANMLSKAKGIGVTFVFDLWRLLLLVLKFVQHLVDVELFKSSRKVIDALR